MLPYGPSELARAFRTVRGNTLQIVEALPVDQMDFRPGEGARTVRELLAHIAFVDELSNAFHAKGLRSLPELDFPGLMQFLSAEEAKPRDKAALTVLLQERGEAFATWLESLDEAFLTEPIPMPPGQEPATKTRLEMIMGTKEHEMHHRGQLMLIARMLGQEPPLTRQRREQMARMAAAAKA
jgi:uncharacterized damage-inducible protein DinB